MSKKPDDWDLEYIYDLSNGSQEIQDLIQAKRHSIINIRNSQFATFKKLDPTPKPKGDVRLSKTHTRQIMSDKDMDKEIEKVKNDFDLKIKDALKERAFQKDKEYIYPIIKGMDKKDLSVLVENGREFYKAKQQEQEKSNEEALKIDLDDIDNNKDYNIYLDYQDNLEDIDKSLSPSDDFE